MKTNDQELLRQNPFQFNWAERYIACVGDNGGTSNDDILAGFKDAALLIIDDIKSGNGTEDELIYPLVYSIRHCVELALKISINLIKDICDIKDIDFGIEEEKLHIHDIEELSSLVKQLYVIDRRIPEIFDTALDYAKDYYFDKKSDVFRYECNLEGKELLKELHISHICIGILENKFLRMYELLNEAIFSLSMMKNEYSVKTWTKELSRHDIEQISRELMPVERWTEEAFDDNRNEIKKKYGLSGNALSKAINIMKSNPLFANNIELHLSLGRIDNKELEKYARLIAEFTDSHILETKECRVGDEIEDSLDRLQKENAKRKKLSEGISNEALFTLAAFGDMFETRDLFCENYQKHYDHFKNNIHIRRDWLIRKVGTYAYALKVLRGMECCGQSTYMNVLIPLIDEIADANNISLRYESWKKYPVITLCGSTSFKNEFMEAQKRLTLEGNIVISVGLFGHSGDQEVWENMYEGSLTKTKEMLDDMHKCKIDMADSIYVINVGGYIGESTRSEIEYAKQHGKVVQYLES